MKKNIERDKQIVETSESGEVNCEKKRWETPKLEHLNGNKTAGTPYINTGVDFGYS